MRASPFVPQLLLELAHAPPGLALRLARPARLIPQLLLRSPPSLRPPRRNSSNEAAHERLKKCAAPRSGAAASRAPCSRAPRPRDPPRPSRHGPSAPRPEPIFGNFSGHADGEPKVFSGRKVIVACTHGRTGPVSPVADPAANPANTLVSGKAKPANQLFRGKAKPANTLFSSKAEPANLLFSGKAKPANTLFSSKAKPANTLFSGKAKPANTLFRGEAEPANTLFRGKANPRVGREWGTSPRHQTAVRPSHPFKPHPALRTDTPALMRIGVYGHA